jgi:hypothetical protein
MTQNNDEPTFIDEVYKPTSYKSCSKCNRLINESSIAKMLEEGQNCAQIGCPYKVRTQELKETPWD